MNRILLQHGDEVRKFITFYQNEKDGSLYITQRRAGEAESTSYHYMKDPETETDHIRTITSPQPKNFEVHYHTSGRINYPEPEFESIFAEPLTRIIEPFWFASFIIPSLSALDEYDVALSEADFAFPLEGDREARRQFDLCISPSDAHITNYGRARGHFTYTPFYTLNVIETDKPVIKPDSSPKFSLLAPRKGLFPAQQLTREAAHIEYQQKRHGHSGPIIYGPNANHEYRIIFQVAATTPPNVMAKLPDEAWRLDIVSVRKSEVRLRVLDGGGNVVKIPIEFSSVELSDNTATLCV